MTGFNRGDQVTCDAYPSPGEVVAVSTGFVYARFDGDVHAIRPEHLTVIEKDET